MNKRYVLVFLSLIFIAKAFSQDVRQCKKISLDVVRMFQNAQSDSIYALFDSKMKKALQPEQISKIWQSLSYNGDFVKVDNQRTKNFQGYLLVETNLVFTDKTYTMRLAFDKNTAVAGMFFVPLRTAKPAEKQPVDNAYYRDEAVTVKTGLIKLPALLCVPKGKKHFPIVVFVHGSGPNDKDETIGPNKIFADLAHELAKKGIASLRYDKRTYVIRSAGDTTIPHSGLEEVVLQDARSAIRLALRTVPEGDKVFLLGHSLGAGLAPEIAASFPQLGGIIMMAAAAKPLEDIVYQQFKYLYKRDGLTCAERKELRKLRKKVKNVKKIDEFLKVKQVPELPIVNDTAFWRDIHGYDALAAAKKLQMPLLLLQGGRDYQVTPDNFDIWKEALGDKKNAEFKLYPGLNHIFHKGEGKSYPEEYENIGVIPQNVVSDIAQWILNNN